MDLVLRYPVCVGRPHCWLSEGHPRPSLSAPVYCNCPDGKHRSDIVASCHTISERTPVLVCWCAWVWLSGAVEWSSWVDKHCFLDTCFHFCICSCFFVDGDITQKHTSRHLTTQHEKTIRDRTLFNSCCRDTTRYSLKTHEITKNHDITCQCVCVKKMTARKAMIIVRVDSGYAKEDTGSSMLN